MLKSPSITIEHLTPIWQRILQRCPIGSDENFFDLGGNDPLADLLFAEIAVEFNRQLPSATIGCAPTIAELAALLDQPAPPVFSPFVLMKPGSEKPPIFIAHGLGGTAGVFEVARHIQTKHPIYGIQAKGIDGLEEPLERVEDMARFYLAALEEIEPHGPYLFIGYSFGGLVMLEMAQQLSENGQHVSLLAMLETYPHLRYLPPAVRLRLIAQRAKYHLHEMGRLPFPRALAYLIGKAKGRLGLASALNDAENHVEARGSSLTDAAVLVEKKASMAMARYQPRFYRGGIKCVVTEIKSYFLPRDPVAVWEHLAAMVEVDTIPGGHHGMLNIQCEGLASVLTRYIQETVL